MFRTIGVKKLFIIVGHLQEMVLAEVDRIRLKYPDREIETAPWTKQGLGADVASLRDRFEGDFALVLGDEFYYQTNHTELARLWKSRAQASSCTRKRWPTSLLAGSGWTAGAPKLAASI